MDNKDPKRKKMAYLGAAFAEGQGDLLPGV
jgi:hypothetical protein